MARRNYLVEGLSGTGKSSVYDELIRRGHHAVSTDRVWAHHDGPVGHDTWVWDEEKALAELERPEPEVLFVCGSSRNRDRFLPWFAKVFNLRIDDETMRRRLEARTADDWPLGAEGVELMLELNRRGEKPAGAIDVDATRPLEQVVDEVLRLAGVVRLEALRRNHGPEVLAFERDNRAYFAAFVSDRGDAFFAEFGARFDELLAEQEARGDAYYVLLDGDGSVLGRFNLYGIEDGAAEVGYRVAERAAGRGVATAGLRELCRLAASEHGLRRLRARVADDNPASRRVLAKAGFVEAGGTDVAGRRGRWFERELTRS